MGGHEDAAIALGHEVAQKVEHLVASDGVEPGCGLVQHEQLRVVREREGQRQLHAHAARQLAYLLFRGQVEAIAQRGELDGVPFAVSCPPDSAHIAHAAGVGEGAGVQHDADARFDGVQLGAAAGDGLAEQAHGTLVGGDDPQGRLDGGGLASAVRSDEADDAVRFHGQAHAGKLEVIVVLAQVVYFHEVSHVRSSFSFLPAAHPAWRADRRLLCQRFPLRPRRGRGVPPPGAAAPRAEAPGCLRRRRNPCPARCR